MKIVVETKQEDPCRCVYYVHMNVDGFPKSYYVWGRDDRSEQGVKTHYLGGGVTPPEEEARVLSALRAEKQGNQYYDKVFGS